MKYKIIVIPINGMFTYRIEPEDVSSDFMVSEASQFFNTSEDVIKFAQKQLLKEGVNEENIKIIINKQLY